MNALRKLNQVKTHIIELETVKQAATDLINCTTELGNIEVTFNCACDPNRLPCTCQTTFKLAWDNLAELIIED